MTRFVEAKMRRVFPLTANTNSSSASKGKGREVPTVIETVDALAGRTRARMPTCSGKLEASVYWNHAS